MAEDSFQRLRLALMQDYLPVGMALYSRVRKNGPLGVFEFPQFAKGTESIALAVAKSGGFSIAGGGETVTAIDHFSVRDKISYISTGGGAFLEYVQGIKLPAVQILEEKVIGV